MKADYEKETNEKKRDLQKLKIVFNNNNNN